MRARKEAERIKRAAKEKVWEDLGKELEEDIRGNKKKIYGMAKAYRKKNTRNANIKDENGNIITDVSKLNERWN